MVKITNWRKTGKNWANGKRILNISNVYHVNTVVGYDVNLYDFSSGGSLSEQRTILKRFKTQNEARQFVGAYMRSHPRG